MTPLTVFFRTLLKSSAIFVGAGYIMLHPSLDMRSTAARRRDRAEEPVRKRRSTACRAR